MLLLGGYGYPSPILMLGGEAGAGSDPVFQGASFMMVRCCRTSGVRVTLCQHAVPI